MLVVACYHLFWGKTTFQGFSEGEGKALALFLAKVLLLAFFPSIFWSFPLLSDFVPERRRTVGWSSFFDSSSAFEGFF